MPLIHGVKRINPLDLNKNVTIGVAFPLDENNMFSGTETMQDQIKANLINLLLTEPGERINLPKYGVGLRNLLFEQKISLDILQEKIQKFREGKDAPIRDVENDSYNDFTIDKNYKMK